MDVRSTRHYVFVKQDGYSRDRQWISAYEAARRLLDARMWVFWGSVEGAGRIKAGNRVAIYVAGNGEHSQEVIATAFVDKVVLWTGDFSSRYPLAEGGELARVVLLERIVMLDPVVDARARVAQLKSRPRSPDKWGLYFKGGVRSVSERDFRILTGQADLAHPARHGAPAGIQHKRETL